MKASHVFDCFVCTRVVYSVLYVLASGVLKASICVFSCVAVTCSLM